MYANEVIENDVQPLNQAQENQQSSQSESSKVTGKITTYLRWVGSILIVLSAISFMIEGNQEFLPAYRYWIGLGLILLLCGGGLVCAYLFKETKGARIFFGLGTVFLSVQVSQVSAMIYGYWHGKSALQPDYDWLQFMDISPTVIAIDFILTGFLLIVVSYASYSILARKHLKMLLKVSIIANIMLLLPVRDATLTPFIIAGLFLLIRYSEHYLHSDTHMRLAEGLAARALVSLPLWIVVARSFLHPVSFLLAMVVSSILVIYCIHDIKRYTKSSLITYVFQWVGTMAALSTWLIVLDHYAIFSSNHLSAMLPIAIILFVLSGQVEFHARLYRFISSVMTLFLTYGAMIDQQSMAPVAAICAGLLLTVAGIKHREKTPLVVGNICVAGGFLFYWEYAVNLYSNAPWISSIALGLAVILLASYIENKENKILAKSRYYYNELKSWD